MEMERWEFLVVAGMNGMNLGQKVTGNYVE